MYLIGQARDIHLLIKKTKKSPIVLGGFSYKYNYEIKAWSDGDVVLHAISNSILGAIGLGDIGVYFPDDQIKNKNLCSKKILTFCLNLMKKEKYKIVNLDTTILCDKIMINPIRKKIVNNLKKLLSIKKINVKATRFEQNLNIIECNAIVLLKKY